MMGNGDNDKMKEEIQKAFEDIKTQVEQSILQSAIRGIEERITNIKETLSQQNQTFIKELQNVNRVNNIWKMILNSVGIGILITLLIKGVILSNKLNWELLLLNIAIILGVVIILAIINKNED